VTATQQGGTDHPRRPNTSTAPGCRRGGTRRPGDATDDPTGGAVIRYWTKDEVTAWVKAPGAPALAKRFFDKVEMLPGDCWIWKGSVQSHGYGQFRINGRREMAHRFAYKMLLGPIPEGLQLDHLCRVRRCVHPLHLEPVTNRENLLRGDTIPAKLAAKTHCLNGHPFDEENTLRTPNGGRRCRECARVRALARYHRLRREAAAGGQVAA
jgi:hypothetical protein